MKNTIQTNAGCKNTDIRRIFVSGYFLYHPHTHSIFGVVVMNGCFHLDKSYYE